jgi:hypothetical protein
MVRMRASVRPLWLKRSTRSMTEPLICSSARSIMVVQSFTALAKYAKPTFDKCLLSDCYALNAAASCIFFDMLSCYLASVRLPLTISAPTREEKAVFLVKALAMWLVDVIICIL